MIKRQNYCQQMSILHENITSTETSLVTSISSEAHEYKAITVKDVNFNKKEQRIW